MTASTARKGVNRGRRAVDNRWVPHDSGPDETLSPDEAYAWSVIERSLRRDLPLHQIERRARLRADRALLLASAGVVIGLVLACFAAAAPGALVAAGMMLAGGSLGVMAVRALVAVTAPRRQVRRPGGAPRRLVGRRKGLFER